MIRSDINMLKGIGTPNSRKFIALAVAATSASSNVTLAVYETEVYLDNNNATYQIVVTLPSVAAARGLVYNIHVVDDGTAHCKVQDQDDALLEITLTSTADGDWITLYSDGRQWIVLASLNFA